MYLKLIHFRKQISWINLKLTRHRRLFKKMLHKKIYFLKLRRSYKKTYRINIQNTTYTFLTCIVRILVKFYLFFLISKYNVLVVHYNWSNEICESVIELEARYIARVLFCFHRINIPVKSFQADFSIFVFMFISINREFLKFNILILNIKLESSLQH